MSESVLNDKRILAVDDEPDVLEVLKEEIMSAAPKCLFETATTYRNGHPTSGVVDLRSRHPRYHGRPGI